jgi:hypothetical protein
MGKRGRKPRGLILQIGADDPTPRYASLNEALCAALPALAEAILSIESQGAASLLKGTPTHLEGMEQAPNRHPSTRRDI